MSEQASYSPGDRVHVTSDAVTRPGAVVAGNPVPGWVRVLPDGWTVPRYWPADRVAPVGAPVPTVVELAHELAGLEDWRDAGAGQRLRYVRWLATVERVPFESDHRGGYVATWERDGYTVRAALTDDTDETGGTWSDERGAGAVENPRYRHERGSVYRWWLPESPATDEDRAAYSAAGMARHAAWLRCERLNRDTMPDEYGSAGGYLLHVTASRDGVDLADEYRGLTVGRLTDPADDAYTWSEVHELAGEVCHAAGEKLAALVAGASR